MKRFFLLFSIAFLLTGCTKSVQLDDSQIQTPVVNRAKQAKKILQAKKTNAKELPSVLGGIIQSDSWIIHRDKQQEEFSGHVFYDNGTYTFKADYALSERTLNRFTATGNVYLKQQDQKGSSYEAYAHKAIFNYKTQQGSLTANKTAPVRLIYTDPLQPTVKATAQKVTFDLEQQIFTLEGNVKMERPSPEGMQTLSANKMIIRQTENYIQLEGNAVLSDGLRFLEAETIVYDGTHNQSYAYGSRPLLKGTTEQGTFAIIADRVSSDAEGNKISLDGKVQGWFVSPEVNQVDFSKFNQGLSYGTTQQ